MSHKIQQLPKKGFLRLPEVLKIFPVSRSTWWQGVKDKRYPQPVKLSERTTAWRVEDIQALIAEKGTENVQEKA
ncbi:MAG: helix-turn-helix transcriptional regulator [Alphaproteobacteria bacterium]